MMPKPIDLTGQKFGRLVAINLLPERDKFGFRVWRWKCDCGNEIDRASNHIVAGKQVSCGCNKIEKARARATHGMHATRTYQAWHAMKQRVQTDREHERRHYKDRGIQVFQPWFDSFKRFVEDVGECPPGKTLDRYPDNDGNYEPGNVRWATQGQQLRNTRRTIFVQVKGERLCLKDACAVMRKNYDAVRSRVRLGATPQEAIDR